MEKTKIPSWVDKKLYPFKPNRFKSSFGHISYVDEGPENPKGTLLMIHGNPQWSFAFRDLISSLQTEYRCIAPDLLGFGLSDKNQELDFSFKMHAESIDEFINHLNLDKYTLVLHDWGGPIGFSHAINQPQKLEKMILFNTWSWPISSQIKEYHLFDRLYYWGFSRFMGGALGKWLIKNKNAFVNQVLPQAAGNKTSITSVIHQYQKVHPDKTSRKSMYVFPAQIMDASLSLQKIWEKKESLKDLPIAIFWGDKDIAFRLKELKIWKNAFPKAQVSILKGIGHCPLEESPEEVINGIREFLKTPD